MIATRIKTPPSRDLTAARCCRYYLALVMKIIFDRQLPNLSMKLSDGGVIVFRFPDLTGKHARQTLYRRPFPIGHPRLVNLVPGCNLLRRLASSQSLKR